MSNILTDNTELFGANAVYIAEVYEKFLNDPQSVSEDWQDFFSNTGDTLAEIAGDFGGAPWANNKTQIVGYAPKTVDRRKKQRGRRKTDVQDASSDSIRAHMLIRAYRVRGHLIANLDPLNLATEKSHPELDPERYGFKESDYDREIYLGGWLGMEKATLNTVLTTLKKAYSGNLGVEFVHIQSLEKKEWLEQRIESSLGKPSLSNDDKKAILEELVEVVGFEEFLHMKYPGTKRFSAEGGENLMIAMEAAVAKAAEKGVSEVVLGMPHRGRLNVLTGFMHKPYTAMISEFEGNIATPDYITSSGDVKYHLGFSIDRMFNGKNVHLSLTANPSHLEAVNPVVMGKVRAKQDQLKDESRSEVMGLLLHGDAAFCGQGVVAETLAMSDLDGYTTGGTVHVIVNNQIGFTTTPDKAHKSPYPTDVAMMIQAPIFHVNGNDPEAVTLAARIAAEYRQEFKKDVVIDMWCYRKYGHNEGDEPKFTQPVMYDRIGEMSTPRDVYADQLKREGVISEDDFDAMKAAFKQRMDEAYDASRNYKPNKADMLEGKWDGLEKTDGDEKTSAPKGETGVKLKKLKDIGKALCSYPDDFAINGKVKRMLDAKAEMFKTGEGFDWATGEALAFGSLLDEGYPVRLSGQDVERGTFSHRHSTLVDQKTEHKHIPLNTISDKQAQYEVVNSYLSEFAVLGFEYGYSQAEPNALTIWEAQFGDFANGAQVIYDQFIASAEVKWLRMSGLVTLLPHGYEGQGPEHSSARLERYLQLCAEENMIVANVTTPANYFHILRRQLKRNFRKPLITMAPKSLLRHKRAVSKLEDMVEGTTFHRVLPEAEKIAAASNVRKVVLCSGKVYYDLLEAREEKKVNDVALLRVEQLYPFPHASLVEELKPYKNAEVIWCQEEPENAGAWTFVDRRIEKVLGEAKTKSKRPTYVGRPAAAATAAGYMKIHKLEQEKLIEEALS